MASRIWTDLWDEVPPPGGWGGQPWGCRSPGADRPSTRAPHPTTAPQGQPPLPPHAGGRGAGKEVVATMAGLSAPRLHAKSFVKHLLVGLVGLVLTGCAGATSVLGTGFEKSNACDLALAIAQSNPSSPVYLQDATVDPVFAVATDAGDSDILLCRISDSGGRLIDKFEIVIAGAVPPLANCIPLERRAPDLNQDYLRSIEQRIDGSLEYCSGNGEALTSTSGSWRASRVIYDGVSSDGVLGAEDLAVLIEWLERSQFAGQLG